MLKVIHSIQSVKADKNVRHRCCNNIYCPYWCLLHSFWKEKNVKEDSKFHKTIMNTIFTIAVIIVLCPWILMVLFYPIMYLLLHVIPS